MMRCRDATAQRIQLIKDKGFKHRQGVVIPMNDVHNEIGHLRSFMSECAVAQYFGIRYDFDIPPDSKRPDIVNGVEVRSNLRANGDLIVHNYDKPAPYILALINMAEQAVNVYGWRDLVDCLMEKYWRVNVPTPAYFVPQSDLHSMQQLKDKMMLV